MQLEKDFSDKELGQIARHIGDELALLAAQINCVTHLQQIQGNPAKQAQPGLYLLHDWYKNGGTRALLVAALKEVGLTHLSAR